MRYLLLILTPWLLHGAIYSTDITPYSIEDNYMDIEILDQKKINIDHIDGYRFREISDLAYHKLK
ncbi:MAG: esterase-like activity of phytase family protein, partial [Campylobacterota bacterium]|nr:esterase-like activity of phytase family protein [Campylobacterota bacterium]